MDKFVAVCTLGSSMQVAGSNVAACNGCYTENLGIEKLVKSIISNPSIRFLVLCGKEVEGRFPGQAIAMLVDKGIDENRRIKNARGYMPYLKTLTDSEIGHFRKQVKLVDKTGEEDVEALKSEIENLENPGEFSGSFTSLKTQVYDSDKEYDYINKWTADDKPEDNWFIVGTENGRLFIDHYIGYGEQTRQCCRITGSRPETIVALAIRMGKVTKLYHAAYLGKELQKAYIALKENRKYSQEFDLE